MKKKKSSTTSTSEYFGVERCFENSRAASRSAFRIWHRGGETLAISRKHERANGLAPLVGNNEAGGTISPSLPANAASARGEMLFEFTLAK